MTSSKDQMFAKVILASKPTNGAPPIVTMHLRYPRIIHSELMTHRVFSRNARSSRAVPAHKMLLEVTTAPFIPWHWGKNQPGMQAGESWNAMVELYEHQQGPDERDDGFYDHTPEEAWLKARDAAVTVATAFMDADYHKQIGNRLLEPFMFIDVLVTSTCWANFLHLRDHEDAEPHIRDLAIMVGEALKTADYQTLEKDGWHLPYINDETHCQVIKFSLPSKAQSGERKAYFTTLTSELAILKAISVARCARISYKPFDGDSSIERELERYDLLVGSEPLHASPAEHQATPDENIGSEEDGNIWASPRLGGNLGAGWIQYRKTLPGEYVADIAA